MTPTPLELTAADGTLLRGLGWGGSAGALVGLHATGGDLDRWRPLAAGREEMTLIAMDRRGHGGSEGAPAAAVSAGEVGDLRATVALARERGAASVVVVAERDAALTALAAVADRGPGRADGLVLLSVAAASPRELPDLRGAGVPKLLIVGDGDPAADAATTAVQRRAIGWTLRVGLPTGAQGAELLDEAAGTHAREQLLRFAAETHWIAAGVARRATA